MDQQKVLQVYFEANSRIVVLFLLSENLTFFSFK